MILGLDKLLQFMAGIFTFMIAMDIPENSIKSQDNLKEPLNPTKMINGLPKLIKNGFLKKMH